MKETNDELPVDMNSALSRFGNDREFFREMVQEFLDHLPVQLRAIEEASRSRNAPEVQKTAHSIKGAAGNLGTARIYRIAATMENRARDRDMTEVASLMEDLRSEILNLKHFAESL